MRGIILAGGTGSRLPPITSAVSKQLMPVYDKPMIYYPLSTLMLAGIKDVLVITTPHEAEPFRRLLGRRFAVRHRRSPTPCSRHPTGWRRRSSSASEHIGDDRVSLVLGDNIFYGSGLGTQLRRFARPRRRGASSPTGCSEPRGVRRGGVRRRRRGRLSLEEKPEQPRSHLAVPGLYFYDARMSSAGPRTLKPSARGELEITDLNRLYLDEGRLRWRCCRAARPGSTPAPSRTSTTPATSCARSRSGRAPRSAAPEEVAWRMGFIDDARLDARSAEGLRASGYGDYLLDLLDEKSSTPGADA